MEWRYINITVENHIQVRSAILKSEIKLPKYCENKINRSFFKQLYVGK